LFLFGYGVAFWQCKPYLDLFFKQLNVQDMTRRRIVLVGCNVDSLYTAPWNDLIFLRGVLFNYAGFDWDDMMLINDYDPRNLPTEQIIVQALQSMTMNVSPDDFFMF
jgi:hypothetical protein